MGKIPRGPVILRRWGGIGGSLCENFRLYNVSLEGKILPFLNTIMSVIRLFTVVVVMEFFLHFSSSVITRCLYVADNTTTCPWENVLSLVSDVLCSSRYGGTLYSSS